MDLRDIQEAVKELKLALRKGEALHEAISSICTDLNVDEALVRHWFLKGEGKTPEEYAAIKFADTSLHTTLAAAAGRWGRDSKSPDLFGRQFHLDYDAWKDRKAERRHYRYVGFTGYWVEAIDEETLETVKFNGGPEIWAEIRNKVANATPYERYHELKFAYDDPDLTARKSILSSIRLALLSEAGNDELDAAARVIDARIEKAENLTVLLNGLSVSLKEKVIKSIEHPSVDAHWVQEGKKKSLSDLPISILGKMKRGETVASPIHQRIRSWREV